MIRRRGEGKNGNEGRKEEVTAGRKEGKTREEIIFFLERQISDQDYLFNFMHRLMISYGARDIGDEIPPIILVST